MTGILNSFKRIVVKIGSATIVDPETGLRQTWLNSLADDLAHLVSRNQTEIVMVSSGAIALGCHQLGWSRRDLTLARQQAAASVGQIELSRIFSALFASRGIVTGQVLLTLDVTEERCRYLNARATLEALLASKSIPIVNENDTVATSEIQYGDNDRLAARVATMINSDVLILLSDVDGLYTAPPGQPGSELIPRVETIDERIRQMAGDPVSGISRGGMKSKIEAAEMATRAGVNMIIASGKQMFPVSRINQAEAFTWFQANKRVQAARKRWIAGGLKPTGKVRVDKGAALALAQNSSLLPIGVVEVIGQFSRGDAVTICTAESSEIAKGIARYDANELRLIAGQKSSRFCELLGYRGSEELIHRDDLVML